MTSGIQDQWAQWVLGRGYGDDPEQQQRVLADLYPVRDRVLRNAEIAEGEALLDVGAGNGLIAFRAFEQVGPHGTVIFSDISQDLLDHCQTLAQQIDALDRCQFLCMSADHLSLLGAASVDIVTTRSVLIYVAAKQQAFNEFYRVLKPNGRLSIFEPINNYFGSQTNQTKEFWGFDTVPITDLVEKVKAIYRRVQPLETNPMMDFNERDLVTFAQEAGFTEIHLELQVNVTPGAWYNKWDAFAHTAPNPCAPTLAEAMQAALTPDEADRFMAYLLPLVKAEQGTKRYAWAYLWAVKRSKSNAG
ncbi:MAG: class I SAM-dependent methyltransferase [Chloroflexales bacterium]|nr:class I SAM-dependent methyltransferase [Chloroflexales bacterium]